MENATKALMIAAAVLVAIIIISLGLAVVRQGQDAITNADLSEAEATQFNTKFTSFEGASVSTTQINSMLNVVLTHNKQEAAAKTNRFVKVTKGGSDLLLSTSASEVNPITGASYYKVTCVYNGTIINEIKVST